jgi:hypothetical protein
MCEFGYWPTKGLRRMPATTSADVLPVLRLIFDAPPHISAKLADLA